MANKRAIKSEVVIAVSAVIISVCALGVSIYETNLMRRQAKAELWPYLHVSPNYNSEGFSIYLQNRGTGPAKVNSLVISVGDRVVKSWSEAITSILGPGHGVNYDILRTNTVNWMVVPAGGEIEAFGVPWTDETRRLVEGFENQLAYRLCYCSVFEECWEVSSEKGEPTAGTCRGVPANEFDG